MFMKLSERGPFGHPLKFRSIVNAGFKYDAYTVLLIKADGDNDGTTFTDAATGKTITPTNVVTKTATKKFGTASAFFSSGSLSVPVSSDFYFDGDFTIDFWVNSSLPATSCFFARSNDNVLSGDLYMYYNGSLKIGGFGAEISTGVGLTANTWQHVALVMYNGTLKVAVDGTFVYSATQSRTYPDEGAFKIGHNYNINYFAGYMDEFRVSKGIARWTDNFTPQTNAY